MNDRLQTFNDGWKAAQKAFIEKIQNMMGEPGKPGAWLPNGPSAAVAQAIIKQISRLEPPT